MNRLFAVFVLMLLAVQAHSVSFKVSDIRLEGLQRVSASPVFAAMPIRVGYEVDDEDIRETIRSLFRTGFFTNVQVARDGNILIVILQERPAIKSIAIDGNKAIKTEQLTDVMTDNGLSEGEILQRHTLQGITRELERQYIAQARYGATVDANVTELPNSLVSIDIEVDEGSAAKIKHINFVGNSIYSDEELLDLFELGESQWYKFFSSSHKYAKEKLTGDIETLESFYLDRGYLDFKVTSTQVSLSPDKKGVFITLNLNEGEIYKVSKVDLAGDPIMDEAIVRRLFLVREGDTFSQGRMTNTSEYITTLLGNAGYTNASVQGTPEKNQEDRTVEVTFFIDPGKRVYVRRIDFSGNTKTSDNVLRRELRQLEGASASNSKIESSKIRLERLGYFKGVQVDTQDVPGYSDLIDINYEVEEQASGSISAQIGYADASGINLGVSVQENNWMGSGKQVSFGITRNRFQDLYSFSFNDPYYTPDGVSRGFSAYYRTTDYDSVNFSGSYSTDSAGFDINFGYPISEISFLRFGFGLVNQSIQTGRTAPKEIRQSPFFYSTDDFRRPSELVYISQSDFERYHSTGGAFSPIVIDGIRQEIQLETTAITDDVVPDSEPGFIDRYGSEFTNAKASIQWRRSTLNRGILATRGNSQQLSFETAFPGSELEYYTVRFDAQAFQPITRNFTLRLKTELAYGDGFGDLDELPFFENFRAGGFGSVRGYERFTLGPRDTAPEEYLLGSSGWEDINGDGAVTQDFIARGVGVLDSELGNSAYVLCEDPSSAQFFGCEPGKLVSSPLAIRSRAHGGNVLMEFSAELILPIPFVDDSRSMQLVAFVDSGNVFSTNCREEQRNCSDVDLAELRTSYGLGFTWISGFGPMTFSFAEPINQGPFDETKKFQFTFGAGF